MCVWGSDPECEGHVGWDGGGRVAAEVDANHQQPELFLLAAVPRVRHLVVLAAASVLLTGTRARRASLVPAVSVLRSNVGLCFETRIVVSVSIPRPQFPPLSREFVLGPNLNLEGVVSSDISGRPWFCSYLVVQEAVV